jgi:hypothetical protein
MYNRKLFSRSASSELPATPPQFGTLSIDGIAMRRPLHGVRDVRHRHYTGGAHLDRVRSHTARAAIRVAEESIAKVKIAVGLCALGFLAIAVLAVGR